ncbi:MAG: hypothetical protein HYZ54_09025 [Ignavibacteriae bacterium]|nr:hypothetical protein [Ignavibacteriota bacterium]
MIISIIATAQKQDTAGNLTGKSKIMEQGIPKSSKKENKPVIHILNRYAVRINENLPPNKTVNDIFH